MPCSPAFDGSTIPCFTLFLYLQPDQGSQEKVSGPKRQRTTPGTMTYLLCKRPPQGLLANMWEFPKVEVEASGDEKGDRQALRNVLDKLLGASHATRLAREAAKGPCVTHVFSHRRHTYRLYRYRLDAPLALEVAETRWVKGRHPLQSSQCADDHFFYFVALLFGSVRAGFPSMRSASMRWWLLCTR